VGNCLSARTEESLKELARQLRAQSRVVRLQRDRFVAVAYTLQTGRDAMEYRLAVIATVRSGSSSDERFHQW